MADVDYKPKLLVFDLDYTLWPFYADTHLEMPLHKKSDGFVYDKYGQKLVLYKDSQDILKKLHEEGYKIAVASRTSEIEGAKKLVELYDLDKYICQKEIYPGCKKQHFSKFQQKLKIAYEDMVFFDDEARNIKDLKEEGVTCVFVRDGINWDWIKKGLAMHKANLVRLNDSKTRGQQ